MKAMTLKDLVFEELSKEVKSIDWELANNEIGDLYLAELVKLGYNQYTIYRHISEYKKYRLRNDLRGGKRNVLVIPDTHIPFEHKDALEALKQAYIEYDITDVIHIGDLIDGHAWSYHETQTNALGIDAELEVAKERLVSWYEAFPEMTILYGNHDSLVNRKAQSGNIPSAFIKSLSEALEVPNWQFTEFLTIGKVFFTHGLGGDAKTRAKQIGLSTVQGHYHSKKYIEYINHNDNQFAMQVGCLVDKSSYAMEYSKFSVIAEGFGVILDIENNPTPMLLNI